MSGPKVIRVVTREEREATFRRQLRRLDSIIEKNRRLLERMNLADEELSRSAILRKAELQELFDKRRFVDVERKTQEHVAFLSSELTRLENRELDAIRARQNRGRHVADSARSILMLMSNNKDDDLKTRLENISRDALFADENSLLEFQVQLQRYAKALEHTRPKEIQKELSQLISSLSRGGNADIEEWLSINCRKPSKVELRLEGLISEIIASGVSEPGNDLISRARVILAQTKDTASTAKVDSLVLEAGKILNDRKTTDQNLEVCKSLVMDLRDNSDPRAALTIVQLEKYISTREPAPKNLLDLGNSIVAEREKKIAVQSRHKSVLKALTELGYEIGNTMETAWVENKRVIARKPSMQDYGVELMSAEGTGKMQIRLVGSDRPHTARNAQRDRDAETIWCHDIPKLSSLLAKEGAEAVVEMALEAGAQPVKTVSFPERTDKNDRQQEPKVRTRRLDE